MDPPLPPRVRSDVGAFEAAAAAVTAVDSEASQSAADHHGRLTKPPGSLGRLEAAGAQLSGIAGVDPPPVPEPAAVAVFAGDHGVLSEGVSPWPAEVTAQMVANFCAGGAAINVLARHTGARVVVVDVGVATALDDLPGLIRANVRRGTANLAAGAAMTEAETVQALDTGAEVAARLVAEGARCLITGDMGIGNTTPSAAVIAALTGRSPEEVTGRGTGIDTETLQAKVKVVERGLLVNAVGPDTPALSVLARVGGLEIAGLAGYMVGGAAAKVPVIVDGVIAAAAALVAVALAPDTLGYLVAGHRSSEPGASAALDHLGLSPLLDLELRLGEGSGACLALPVLQAAAKILREMATFDSAGVTDKQG